MDYLIDPDTTVPVILERDRRAARPRIFNVRMIDAILLTKMISAQETTRAAKMAGGYRSDDVEVGIAIRDTEIKLHAEHVIKSIEHPDGTKDETPAEVEATLRRLPAALWQELTFKATGAQELTPIEGKDYASPSSSAA